MVASGGFGTTGFELGEHGMRTGALVMGIVAGFIDSSERVHKFSTEMSSGYCQYWPDVNIKKFACNFNF
jgi:hypothetical protein